MKSIVLALIVLAVSASTAQAQAGKVLVFHGQPDPVTDAGVTAIKEIGTAGKFTADDTADAGDISAENLAGYRAVVFLNTAGDMLDSTQEAALKAYVEGGGGFVGIGRAAEGETGNAWFDGLIGARPAANSPTTESQQVVVPGDRVHPSTRDLPLLWNRSDIWYTWQTRPTGTVHTVARYHAPNAPAGDGTNIGGTDNPISWCRDYSGGRSFYTGMGRVAGAYSNADFRTHLTGAIQWAAALVRGNCKATINSNYKGTRIVNAGPVATGLATSGESHGLTVAPNGWVIYIGRGDCRTDSERGSLLGLSSLARSLDHRDVNVGLGCGSVHVWDPAQYNGKENSGVTLAGKLAVYGDGGQGGERTDQGDHKMEYGLLGVTTAPDFATTGHIYLQYFPSFNPNSSPPGLPLARRVSKMSRPRISRFTINLATKKLDLKSEVRIFEYDAQIYSCCHVGGGMGFDSEGNLYVTTGDTNSSQGSNGYSGNNPVAKCPTGPDTEAVSTHCGSANYSYQDARRTAGNTNDYNGKMLRFKPKADIPDGTQPPVGVNSTYTLPTKDSPNGPNLFDGTEGGGGKTKPEIYAMGLRNPSRLSIDPKTDVPYAAWVGPDAGAPNVDQGPSTYENAAQVSRAGNYGWPYCMGNKQAYRDRIGDGSLRTSNAEGYVNGGPTGGAIPGWYDCDNLVNDSPNNTGLTVLPHVTGTGMDAGKVRGNNLWYSRGNPGNANGCPDFERPNGAPNYGAQPTQLCPYAQNNGMTIMDGPVYRYKEGADNSRRWPDYWDGRWFLHNNGGPSIKHGLLLDPATDQDGGLPIYADSLRNALNWDGSGSYMDSKFGPDGALYVQTYDGFFRANPGVSIFRYDYVGGPATPGATAKGIAIGNFEVRFSSAGSGGVSYEWNFGDGSPVSNEANPTHKYPEAKRYTAKLTVTYADGAKDTKTVEVNVLEKPDETAPVTSAALDPASPGAGGTYNGPVTVSLTATDEQGGSGVEKTEYRVNGGQFQTYTAPFTRTLPGMYNIEFRSTDFTGNVENPPKSVAFTIAPPSNCPANQNDEFGGTSLDPKWQVLRRDDSALSVANGKLKLLVRSGDMFAGTATARNVLLQNAPPTSWTITTKIDVSTLADEGEQAGFVLWQNEDGPNNFAKITYIDKGASSQFEWVATRNDSADIHVGPQFDRELDEVYLRVRANGAGTYVPEYSLDGEDWDPISTAITGLGDPRTLKFGLKLSDNANNDAHAAVFDFFYVDCTDRMAPTTQAKFTPETPDGDLGWYTTAPKVELVADDGPLGKVDSVQYSLDGAPLRTYEGPFTVSGDGDHTLAYFARDDKGNIEETKRKVFRVDTTAPSTNVSMSGDGPVDVTLDASDASGGSGVELTQYRVDGGPWTAYSSKDEQLLDSSEGSLAQWLQAPDGRFERMTDGSGGITPIGGLGMLWFPKPYRDFSLKLQFREGQPDPGRSNGGVFVRFPDPRGEPREPCENFGSARTSDAWVAIYCGYEIQIYDGTGSESRKTGSIYTFKNNDINQIGPRKPTGQWEDYEIRVTGRHFEILRDGVKINEWDNNPGIQSDRGGDPSSSLRQFTEGYIGLQNHGGADTVQYRNIRVQDLTPGAPGLNPTGPFKVSGDGPHTIEVRSVDAAGNVERTTPHPFEIGSVTPPSVSPSPPANPVMPPAMLTPSSYKLGSFAPRLSARTLARRGLRVPVTCTGAMTGSARLTVSRSVARRLKLSRTTLDTSDVRCWGPQTARITLKPSKSLARRLTARGGPRTLKVSLTVTMRDFGRPATTTRRTITIKRR